MGGKTGTAQKVPRDGVNYLVSFIGFAPVDDPQLMIYCFVDEPNSQDQPHSTFAQNIVREILEEVLPYMNIYPDEDLVEGQIGLVAHGQVHPGLFLHDALAVGEGLEAHPAVVGPHPALAHPAEAHGAGASAGNHDHLLRP